MAPQLEYLRHIALQQQQQLHQQQQAHASSSTSPEPGMDLDAISLHEHIETQLEPQHAPAPRQPEPQPAAAASSSAPPVRRFLSAKSVAAVIPTVAPVAIKPDPYAAMTSTDAHQPHQPPPLQGSDWDNDLAMAILNRDFEPATQEGDSDSDVVLEEALETHAAEAATTTTVQ
jgi:hypothetical protein